mgnify:CR=1 FL=1
MKERDPNVEAQTREAGVVEGADWMNIMLPQGRGSKRKAAVAAVAPRRQQTLDDFEFSLGSKQTMQDALNELSADEISDMFRAMDKGPGVDVRSGRNKMAHDILEMKRGIEAGGSVDETGALFFDYGKMLSGRKARALMRSKRGEEDVGTLW